MDSSHIFAVCRRHPPVEERSQNKGNIQALLIHAYPTWFLPAEKMIDVFKKAFRILRWMLSLLFQKGKTIMPKLSGENIFLDFFPPEMSGKKLHKVRK
jgi:hypothetical protein